MIGHTIKFEDEQWSRFIYWVDRARQKDPELSPSEQVRNLVRLWITIQEKDHVKA